MRPGRDTALAVCLAAAVLAAAASLVPVVSGPGWLVELTATLLVLTAVSVVLGRLGAPGWAVAAAQVVVLVEVLTVVHAPAQAVVGLLPGPAAIAHAGDLLEQAVAVVQGQSAPIDAVPGVRLGLTAAGGAVLVLAHALALALRRPALVGLPLVAVHGVGVVFAPGGLGVGPFLLAAAGWLLVVLVARTPAPRWGPVVAPAGPVAARPGLTPLVVAGALVVALAVPAALALPSSPTFFVGRGGGGGVTSVNPLLDLRDDLEDRSDTVVMRYRVDRGAPQPLRVVTVDSFDGSLWRPAERLGVQPLPTGTSLEAPPGLDQGTPVEQRRLAVTIETLRQEYLPLPYPVTQVDVDGRWEEDRATATVTGTGSTRTNPGLEYRVDYQQVSPDPAVLAAAPSAPPEILDAYAVAPPDLPPVIAETARQVVDAAGATTDYDEAVALQEWFKDSGLFDYTTTLSPPNSPSALVDFLEDQEGYCVHFSSAMAVMARTLGIPARVAVGFLPGRASSGVYQVRASDAHAWPELYFEGAGWTRFEPTPSRGDAPAWTVPATSQGAQEPVPGQEPGAVPQQSPEDVRAPGPQPDAGAGADAGAGTGSAAPAGTVLAVAGGVAAVLLLLSLPALARRRLSVRRWRRALGRGADGPGGRPAPAEAAWADLVERLGDLGVGPAPSATPRQVRSALLDRLGTSASAGAGGRGRDGAPGERPEVAASLVDLVGAVERSRYGSAGTVGATAGVRDGRGLRGEALRVERAVRSTVGRRRALLARWWPSSGRRALLDAPSRWLDRTRDAAAGHEVEQVRHEDALR